MNEENKTSKKNKYSFNIFTKAAHGFSFLMGIIKKDNSKFKVQKTTGDILVKELDKVYEDNKESIRQSDKDDRKRIEEQIGKKNISFKYKVKDSWGKTITSTFEAPTKNDVIVFLKNEGYEIIEIKERGKYDIDINFSSKMKMGDLAFMLTQLATYLKAGIPLIQAVRILEKQQTKQFNRKILNKIVYELVLGEKFSVALQKQKGTFPALLVNMVRTSEMTGDLAGTLDEMAKYYTDTEKTRKAMISALIYPAVIFTAAVLAVFFIMIFVVPQFVAMFQENNADLPGITVAIISASNFLAKNVLYIVIGLILLIITLRWSFQNVPAFKKRVQIIFMHFPVFGNVIIYKEVSMICRTFASLLDHNVFITDSMEILSKLSSNEVYKEIINRTIINLSKGGKISDSFRGEWAFPVVAYEMLVTGESTGQLGLMMTKVAEHFQSLHENSVTAIKSLIEPVIIVFLAVIVGIIVMSIIVPMFSLYNQLS